MSNQKSSRHKGRDVPPPRATPALDTSERRVRACLQACEGLTTEALEDGMVKIVFDAPFQIRDVLAKLRAILPAAREVLDPYHRGFSKMCDAVEIARGQTPQAATEPTPAGTTGEQEGQSNDG